MRVTNNMIMNTTKSNINRNKIEVDRMNTQMSTQKKIDVPSDDPVIAVRSLRLRSTLNQIDQYLNTNVKDAESWIEMTQSSLTTLNSVLDKIHTQCNDGSNTYLTQSNRNTILTQLKQLRDQIYQEGNNDYAGRTIFTGYKTNTTLTFQTDSKASYTITEPSSYEKNKERLDPLVLQRDQKSDGHHIYLQNAEWNDGDRSFGYDRRGSICQWFYIQTDDEQQSECSGLCSR